MFFQSGEEVFEEVFLELVIRGVFRLKHGCKETGHLFARRGQVDRFPCGELLL